MTMRRTMLGLATMAAIAAGCSEEKPTPAAAGNSGVDTSAAPAATSPATAPAAAPAAELLAPATGPAAATPAAVAPVAAKRSAPSPAPDMPAEWFIDNAIHVTAAQRELVGKPAPALNVGKWYQGDLKQSDLAGKVVLIDFWATWCAPCRVAMPHTDALAAKYKDQGLVALAICVEGDEPEVAPFIADKKLKLPMAWDKDEATYRAFGGEGGYPTYAVVDRKGIIRAIGLSSPDGVDKAIEKLLAEK